ncbi:hypothetical protein LBMAG39_14830 [Cyanobium sp.]|nr:hypothetical protein LBMAG39_14830 [Cyanobium sp.]
MSGGRAAAVVGIDVGGTRKGFHAVALGAGVVIDRCRTADPQGLARWCADLGAALVAQRLAAGAPCSVYGAVDSGVVLLPSAAAW